MKATRSIVMNSTTTSTSSGSFLTFCSSVLSTPILSVTIFVGLLGYVILLCHYWLQKDKKGCFSTTETSTVKVKPQPLVRSIWDFNKANKERMVSNSVNISHSKPTQTNAASNAKKQFHNSTYYYSHNKFTSGGGYTDGLAAEDYTMNQPRLLSKNGVSFLPNKLNAEALTSTMGMDNVALSNTKERTNVELNSASRQPHRVIHITKYLWDDSEAVSIIRIEVLPSIISQENITWSQANIPISNIQIRLIEKKGLTLCLKYPLHGHGTTEIHYLLHLPNLYGKIDSASIVSKSRRLLVKLVKAEGYKFRWPCISSAGSASSTTNNLQQHPTYSNTNVNNTSTATNANSGCIVT